MPPPRNAQINGQAIKLYQAFDLEDERRALLRSGIGHCEVTAVCYGRATRSHAAAILGPLIR